MSTGDFVPVTKLYDIIVDLVREKHTGIDLVVYCNAYTVSLLGPVLVNVLTNLYLKEFEFHIITQSDIKDNNVYYTLSVYD